jgi:hypothetical protein
MPATSEEIRRRIGLRPTLGPGEWSSIEDDSYPGGLVVDKGAPLFPRIRSEA